MTHKGRSYVLHEGYHIDKKKTALQFSLIFTIEMKTKAKACPVKSDLITRLQVLPKPTELDICNTGSTVHEL